MEWAGKKKHDRCRDGESEWVFVLYVNVRMSARLNEWWINELDFDTIYKVTCWINRSKTSPWENLITPNGRLFIGQRENVSPYQKVFFSQYHKYPVVSDIFFILLFLLFECEYSLKTIRYKSKKCLKRSKKAKKIKTYIFHNEFIKPEICRIETSINHKGKRKKNWLGYISKKVRYFIKMQTFSN